MTPTSPNTPILQLVLRADRSPQEKHPGERSGIAHAGSNRQEHRTQLPPAQNQKQCCHHPAAHHRRPRGADGAECRHTQVAVDQHPVEPCVHQIGDEHRDDDRAKPAHRLKALAKHDEGKEAEGTWNGHSAVRPGDRHNLGRLIGPGQHALGGQEHRGGGETEQRRENHPALHSTRRGLVITGADRLSHHGIERHEHAHAEDGDAEEVQVTQCHRRQGLSIEVPDHDGVDHSHRHHADLYHDHRQAEPEQDSHVGGARENAGREGQEMRGEKGRAPRGEAEE